MKKLVVLLTLVTFSSFASAALLDWAVVDWTGGSLSNTYFNVDGVGVDIAMDFTGDTAQILTSHSQTTEPLPTDLHSWAAPGLWWAANFNQAGQSLTLTITFDSVVSDVAFSVYDIDGTGELGVSGNWETLAVSGSAGGSSVSPAITVGAQQLLSGNVIQSNGYDTNPGDPDLTSLIQFSSVDTIVLLYHSNVGTERGEILSNIEFVPEPATLLLLAAGGILAGRRRR